MELKNKIIEIYPSLTDADFSIHGGTIILRNDGECQYIQTWSHPDFPQPTEQQLAEIK
jgi:hypothetical protein